MQRAPPGPYASRMALFIRARAVRAHARLPGDVSGAESRHRAGAPGRRAHARRRSGRVGAALGVVGVLLVGAQSAHGTTRAATDPMASPLTVLARAHGGRFAVDGSAVVLRGFDYQPLVLTRVAGRSRQYANETFVTPFYNPTQVVAMLARWQAEGYNSVRVFLNPGQIGNPHGAGLSASYVANVADFTKAAAAHGVRTLITVGALPAAGRFTPQPERSFGGVNAYYLSPTYIAAQNRYLMALIAALKQDGAPLVDVLFELKGEQNWNNSAAPLNWKRGNIRTADGQVYNMASATSRAAMETGNLVHWANALAATVHRLVPGSLVGVGVYPPSVKRPKWTVRPQALFTSATQTDFVDIHVYPNLGPELTQVTSFGAGATRKPIIMGEFGATRRTSVPVAVKQLLAWQTQSCRIGGVSVSGWLLWTWNSSVDTEFWDALADGALIERALSPQSRPDPCR